LPPAAASLPPAAWELCCGWTGSFKGLFHLLWPFTYYVRFIPKIYGTQSKAWNKNKPSLKMQKSHFTVIYAVDNMFWLQID